MKNEFKIFASGDLKLAADILSKRLSDRGLKSGENGIIFKLSTDSSLKSNTYSVSVKNGVAEIVSDSLSTLFAGIGCALRSCTFSKGGVTMPDADKQITPVCTHRWVYLANHFHNYYQMASLEELNTYLEDLCLWGFNGLYMIIPKINIVRRGDEDHMFYIDRLEKILKYAKKLEMKIGYMPGINQTFRDYPKELTAVHPLGFHPDCGNILCYSKPESVKIIDDDNRFFFEEMKNRGIIYDSVMTWPYDEGGCGCDQCAPWGANGYLRAAKRAFEVSEEFYPGIEKIVSTWTFDSPDYDEWGTLDRSLENDKWCDMILADNHEDYPRYPLDKHVPGDLPLISFPEISMWGLYPWGGFGALAFPERMTRIWRQTNGLLSGEALYSEGIFEDINKVTIAGLCEDFDRDPHETMRQYARYELGCDDENAFVRLIHLIEENHVQYEADKTGDTAKSDEALKIANKINDSLPEFSKNCWRWRQIYIRVLLDSRRYRGEDICAFDDTLEAMHELIDIYHCLKNYDAEDEPYHERVRPICPMY